MLPIAINNIIHKYDLTHNFMIVWYFIYEVYTLMSVSVIVIWYPYVYASGC